MGCDAYEFWRRDIRDSRKERRGRQSRSYSLAGRSRQCDPERRSPVNRQSATRRQNHGRESQSQTNLRRQILNAQDKAAARVLAALSYNLLVGAMDFGDVLEAL